MSMTGERYFVNIGSDALDPRALEQFVATPASGGVVTFAGVVRNEHQGRSVLRIEYVAAVELAQAKLHDIAMQVLEDPAIHKVAAFHRVGLVRVGEASVIVAASAAHRDDAFRGCRRLIDRIKEVLPVWKREHFADGKIEWAAGFTIAEADRSPGVSRAEAR